MTALRVLALADDLTGALEVGARFEGAVVALGQECGAPVLVVDTESRHLRAEEAARRVRESCLAARADLIYKKTDSTLRGNIGAELGALPGGRIHYVPAYPRMGRVVRGGELLVDGVAVHRTAFGKDPLDPVKGSDIRAMLVEQGAALERIEVYDGETDEDVRAAAQRILDGPRPWLAAGPAALAGELAELLGLERKGVRWPEVPRCFVINGSAHPASAAQMAYGLAHGLGEKGWRQASIEEADQAPEALVIFGGDTAREVLRGFGDPLLHPLGEVLPGVPVTWFSFEGRRWVLVTKAGGFGGPDLLTHLHERLKVIQTGEEDHT